LPILPKNTPTGHGKKEGGGGGGPWKSIHNYLLCGGITHLQVKYSLLFTLLFNPFIINQRSIDVSKQTMSIIDLFRYR